MKYELPEFYSPQIIELDGVKINYVRKGSGPALLLLHGFPGFWWDWRYLIEPLSNYFDVIVPDLRGSGDSENTALSRIEDYEIGQLAEDQARLLDALNIDKCHIMSHDYGSMAAHKFLRKYPEKVIKCVMLDPVMPVFTEGAITPSDWYALFNALDMAETLISSTRKSTEAYYRHFFDSWGYKQPVLNDEEFEVLIDNYMKTGNVLGGLNYDRANLTQEATPWSPHDYQPTPIETKVLWAAQDSSITIDTSRHLHEFYSNYTLEVIEDCGHFVMLEQPAVVLDKALTFLRN